MSRKLKTIDYDAMVILTPHWQTYIGTHFLGCDAFKSLSVDPIFPNLFRYHYDLKVDVELSEKMREIETPAALKTTISELLDKTLRPNNAPINETYGSTS